MNEKTTKPVCGVIGLGKMGRLHAEKYMENPMCEYYGSYDSANDSPDRLDDLLDACTHVSICTPANAHADLAILAMSEGCNVLIEKPMALSYADCERVYQYSLKSGRRVTVGHLERYDNCMNWAIANLLPKVGGFCRLTKGPKRTDASAVYDLMIHDIDNALAMIGHAEVERIERIGVTENAVACKVHFACGFAASFMAGYNHRINVRRAMFDAHTVDMIKGGVYRDGVLVQEPLQQDKLRAQIGLFVIDFSSNESLQRAMEAVRVADKITAAL